MITFKGTGLSKKEQSEIASLICEITDIYGDFYLTKNNLRLFIKENLNTFFETLKKGDKIAYDESGVAIVTGFSDKMNRKYVKILVKKPEDASKLLQALHWNIRGDLYTKVKKNNPLKEVYEKNGFEFLGGRGKEILLIRKEDKNVNRNKR
jgi:hypothetical protein